MQPAPLPPKLTIYIRKLNGIGQKIAVEDSLQVQQLKQIARQLKSLEAPDLKDKQFRLVFKNKNITLNESSTLKELGIPNDGIIHIVFGSEQQKKTQPFKLMKSMSHANFQTHPTITTHTSKLFEVNIKVIFNEKQHQFSVNLHNTVLQLKKKIATRLNLIYESLILSLLGGEMHNDKTLASYGVESGTLVSLKFNLQKPQKKKLETRMVSSVTFSDENNEPNKNQIAQEFENPKSKLATSSKSFGSDKEQTEHGTKKLTSLLNSNTNPMMYKSDINSFGSSQTSKAAMMFKNALHQKIVETQSVVSGSFSQENSISGNDPNSLMITCQKTHQIVNIREKLMVIEKVGHSQKIEISMQEDLFQSIDLNKSGCVTLNEIVKKMGKERAVFIYRLI